MLAAVPARRAFVVFIACAMALSLVATLGSPARALTGEVLYGADGAGGNTSTNLYTLDPLTGAIVATVGPIGFPVTGLAVDPTTGILYGTTARAGTSSPGFLITIDKATGAGTVVGDLRAATTETAADITFGADGTLYGWLEPGTDDLVTINLTTGTATVVGDSGLGTYGSALAGSGNPLTFAGDGDGGCLSLIDTGTGAATCPVTLDGTTDNAISAAAFNAAGTLFAVRLNNSEGGTAELITINTVTGAITVVGDTVSNLDAIAFNPAQPLVATKTANAPTSPPAGGDGYVITISNPNAGAATITSITDTLPAGFTYVPGSTTGATTADPSIAGSLLTWTGLSDAPAGGTVALSFDVIVSATPGAYLNEAGGTAEGNTLTGTGPTASIQVTALPTASINDVSVTEGNTGSTVNATFTVTLSQASATPVSMSFATANGTATAPSDYQAATGTVTFLPGDVSETITVNVVGDAIDEPNETFLVNLSAPVGAALADAQGIGTIVDDDAVLSDTALGADESAGSSGLLPAIGLLLAIVAVSFRRSRSRAAIRDR